MNTYKDRRGLEMAQALLDPPTSHRQCPENAIMLLAEICERQAYVLAHLEARIKALECDDR